MPSARWPSTRHCLPGYEWAVRLCATPIARGLWVSRSDLLQDSRRRHPGVRLRVFATIPIHEVLLRPEEVVLASSSASVDDGFFGRRPYELPLVRFDEDTVSAMSTSVFQLYPVSAVLAVDQQQEVDRSRYSEALIAVQGHGMERESQAVQKSLMVFSQGVFIHRLAVG